MLELRSWVAFHIEVIRLHPFHQTDFVLWGDCRTVENGKVQREMKSHACCGGVVEGGAHRHNISRTRSRVRETSRGRNEWRIFPFVCAPRNGEWCVAPAWEVICSALRGGVEDINRVCYKCSILWRGRQRVWALGQPCRVCGRRLVMVQIFPERVWNANWGKILVHAICRVVKSSWPGYAGLVQKT